MEEESDEIKKYFGYSMIGFTALNVGVNTCIMLVKTYFSLKKTIIAYWRKFKILKLKKAGLYIEGVDGSYPAPEFVGKVF